VRVAVLAVAVAFAVTLAACAHAAQSRCELPGNGTLVHRDGAATLTRWDLDDTGALFTAAMPGANYRAFLERPMGERPEPKDDAERALWRREDHNAELVMSGRAGTLRPVQCIEALTYHPERESIVLVLRNAGKTRVYVGRSDQTFPPKSVYGTTEAAADIAAGWSFDVVLHNHTVPGVPTLSTADVSLFRNLDARSAWVTNGVYTVEVRATELPRFLGRDE
jgi:hypothetical protein